MISNCDGIERFIFIITLTRIFIITEDLSISLYYLLY